MRLIDADELKEDLRQYFTDGVLDGVSAKLAFHQIMHDIDNAPTVELHMGRMTNGIVIPIERPQGEWARHDEWVGGVYVGGFYHVNCTCEDGYYSKWETNFCPNCGRPMKKGAEE